MNIGVKSKEAPIILIIRQIMGRSRCRAGMTGDSQQQLDFESDNDIHKTLTAFWE